jgi:hypothetical protein
LDRRNLQVLSASGNLLKSCIHTKSIFSLIDLDFEDEAFVNITKHTEKCEACSTALKNFELQNQQATFFIPKPQIDADTKAAFEREVHDVFRIFELNEKEQLRLKIKNKIKNMDTAGAEFLQNLGSKKMMKSYAFGLVLFVVLRQFFS